MGLNKPRQGHASVSRPARLAAMDHGEEAPSKRDSIWQRKAREEMQALGVQEKLTREILAKSWGMRRKNLRQGRVLCLENALVNQGAPMPPAIYCEACRMAQHRVRTPCFTIQ